MARVESSWSPEGIFTTEEEIIGEPENPSALAPARYPLEIINPKPSSQMQDYNRYKWTHTNVPYRVPIGILGGKPPFNFSIAGISGATITGLAPYWNPKMISAGEVNIPAGVQGTYTVTVTDQDGASDSVTVTVQKSDSRFIFIDQSGSSGNPGTYASPKQNMNDVWTPHGHGDTPYKNSIIVFREGSYTTPDDTSAGGYVEWHSGKPRSLMAFPGEMVTVASHGSHPNNFSNNVRAEGGTFKHMHEIFISGMTFQGGGGWYIYRGETSNHVYYKMKFIDVDMNRWTGSEENIGGINYGSGRHVYHSFIDLYYQDCKSAQWNNHAGLQFYCVGRSHADIIESKNSDYSHTVYLKSSSQHVTFTSLSIWSDTYERRGVCYSYNSGNQYDKPFDNVTSATSIAQYRYSRLFDLPSENGQGEDGSDSCVLVAHESAKAYGQNFMDRCVLIGGISPHIDSNPPADGVAAGTFSRCLIVNNQGWWGFHVPEFYTQDYVVTEFYRDNQWQNVMDSEGRVITSDRFKIGWEI